ncbi:MAG: efflux RND transporter periplasmic adaptor subunit [Candidatus Sericytochromatia bacterium]|nr:efflux RND transporter periplasmic adaptor subunit [Candidatus Sericytochromatia bacterium]
MTLHLPWLWALLPMLALVGDPAEAHEGPHGAEGTPVVTGVRHGERVTLETRDVDMVLVVPEGREGTIELWLADATAGTPVVAPRVDVLRDLGAGRRGRVRLVPDAAVPGRFAAGISWPRGPLALTVEWTGRDGRVRRAAMPAMDSSEDPRSHGTRYLMAAGATAGTGLLLLAAWASGRRRRTARASGMAGLLLLAQPVSAGPHHDHGAHAHRPSHAHGEHPLSSGARVPSLHVPIEVQFAMDLRTVRVARGSLVREHRLAGQLVPDASRATVLRAPRAGLLESGAWPGPGYAVRTSGPVGRVREWPGVGERVQIQVETNALARDTADAEAALSRAEARRALALKVLQRFAGSEGVVLGTARDGASRDLAEAEADLAASRHRLAALRAIVRPGQASAGPVPVLAPAGFVVTRVLARPGEAVMQGQALLEGVDPGRLWFQAQVPEDALEDLGAGGTAQVCLDSVPGRSVPVRAVGHPFALDPVTRQALVPFHWPRVDAPSGAAGLLTFRRTMKTEVLVLPEVALRENARGESVVVVKTAPETFRLFPIHTGLRATGQVEVKEGLAEGRRVVVQGVQALWTALVRKPS